MNGRATDGTPRAFEQSGKATAKKGLGRCPSEAGSTKRRGAAQEREPRVRIGRFPLPLQVDARGALRLGIREAQSLEPCLELPLCQPVPGLEHFGELVVRLRGFHARDGRVLVRADRYDRDFEQVELLQRPDAGLGVDAVLLDPVADGEAVDISLFQERIGLLGALRRSRLLCRAGDLFPTGSNAAPGLSPGLRLYSF